MESRIARPVDSHKGAAARAHISRPVAAKGSQIWERNIVRSGNGSSSPNARPYSRAAPIATRMMETTNGSNIATSGPSRRPTSSAPLHSRPGVTSGPARNFSRPQGVSGTTGAAPIASRPNMRGHAVREVGFENWATRHETIAAHPVRAPLRGRPRRVCSAILEEDEAESDVLPALPLHVSSEMQVRVQGETARRSPGLVVHAGAAPVRSEVASLVAATESVQPVKPARHSWPKTRPCPHPAVLPSTPLRHNVGHTAENPRTYMDMHARYERAPTRLIPKSRGAALDFGDNCSPWSPGTTMRDVRRRAALGLRVPLPGNEVEIRLRGRERVFRGEFVDEPVWIGRGREMRRPVGVEERESEKVEVEAGGSEVVPSPLEGVKEERKKGWQRVSAFLARRMGRKEKGAAPSSSPETPSPATPPSLVYGGPSSTPSPARAPATPPQVHFAAPVVISGPPYSTPRTPAVERTSTSPPKTALKRTSPQPCSPLQPQKEEQQHPVAPVLARAIASASAFPLPPIADEEEEDEDEPSPLPDVDDADVFPSPLAASQRWAQPRPQPSRESLHEAVADAVAEEIAEADWSGALLKRAESVKYVGKGKGRVVDVRGRPSRYHGRRVVAEASSSGSGGEGDGKARRDTIVVGGGKVPGAWPVGDGEESRGPVVAISGLR